MSKSNSTHPNKVALKNHSEMDVFFTPLVLVLAFNIAVAFIRFVMRRVLTRVSVSRSSISLRHALYSRQETRKRQTDIVRELAGMCNDVQTIE